MTGPKPTIEALARRIEAIEETAEIQRTAIRYAHALDYGLEEQFVDCFVPDAVYEVVQRADLPGGAMRRRSVGHAELAQWASAHTRAPEAYHKHCWFCPDVELGAGRATMRSYFVRVDEGPAVSPHIFAFGRYLDELVACDDGRWRFQTRVVEIEARTRVDPPARA